MVLAADLEPAGQAMGRPGDGACGVAALHDLGLGDIGLGRQRLRDRQHRRSFGDVERDQRRCVARGGKALGDHARDRMADVLDRALGEQGLAAQDRRDVVGAGDVGGGEHGRHARRPQRCPGVDGAEFAAGGRALDQESVQRAGRLGNVVDIGRGAGDVPDRAVVAHRRADAAGGRRAARLHRGVSHRKRRRS